MKSVILFVVGVALLVACGFALKPDDCGCKGGCRCSPKCLCTHK